MSGVPQPFGLSTAPVRSRVRRSSACICRIRERGAAFCGSQSSAGTQIRKDNEVRRNEVGTRLAAEAVDADTAGTRDGVAYQSLRRADQKGGQRNLPERLFVLLEIAHLDWILCR
jgi:hypothetical protein